MFGGKTQDSDGNDNKTTTNKVVTQEYRNALNKGWNTLRDYICQKREYTNN